MKRLFFYTLCLFLFLSLRSPVYSVENPIATPNNKVGIHILFPDELQDASKLVNANGGEWGYVIIPIQSGDRNLEKWQKFMDLCRDLRIVPIIRIATEGDYFNTTVWRKPNELDVIDFANFLHSLSWPTKNRYIVVFNEVNRASEWGGQLDPHSYANTLSYAVNVFKSKSKDFFIISAGMDNAAPNKSGEYMNVYDYMRAMQQAVPGIFNQIDGFSSHSYPNPAFAQSTKKQDGMSIATFRFERDLIKSMRADGSSLPVFITETGWSLEAVSDETIASYYKEAFSSVWNDDGVVAVTPFLLRSGGGPFTMFSFLTPGGEPTQQYKAIAELPKVKGKPLLENKVLGSKAKNTKDLEDKEFPEHTTKEEPLFIIGPVKDIFKWLLKMN